MTLLYWENEAHLYNNFTKQQIEKAWEREKQKVIEAYFKQKPPITLEEYLKLKQENFTKTFDTSTLESKYLDHFKNTLLKRTQELADAKLKQAKALIAEKEVTPEQEERYKTKYELALKAKESGDYSKFELGASLLGITPEELVESILAKGEEWKTKLEDYALLIDDIRVATQSKIKATTDLEKLKQIDKTLRAFKDMGVVPTQELLNFLSQL